MKRRTLTVVGVLGVLALMGCGPAEPPSVDLSSVIPLDASYPGWVKTEVFNWYAGLPREATQGITSAAVVFTASDGHVYPTQASLSYRGGSVKATATKTASRGRQVIYQGGKLGPVLPDDGPKLGARGLSAQGGYTCILSNGPYFRSWTDTGYAAISSDLNLLQLPALPALPDPSTGTVNPVNAYVYIGGQASGHDLDAGLIYHDGAVWAFVTNPSERPVYWEIAPGLKTGTDYPVRLQADGDGGFFFRLDTTSGTVFANRVARNIGTNLAGTNTYFKRAVSLASNSLPNYNGSPRYDVTHLARHTNSKVGVYQNGAVVYQPYSAARQNTEGCRVPASQVQLVSGSVTGDSASVSINMSN